MPKLDMISHSINLPEGVTATIAGHDVTLAKDGKSLTREFRHPRIEVRDSSDGIEVFCNLPRRKEKALAGTWAAHLNNMARGVDSGFKYKLKAVYSHFPMTIKVQGNEMTITNLFGEKVPRVAPLPWSGSGEVVVEVSNKTDITVSGADREKVGQTAANIERACRIKKRDRRVFQDGIYIVSKGNE
ncbi:MAG: 50S ribosomal protein L6 [Candidatus Thermoplasmatota archaeon]|nr:50S ribosomal protein L6 [Candidatus Thermoplasmatota archaeon]